MMLLCDLKSKLYKVEHLKKLLRHCQLYDVLTVIAEPGNIFFWNKHF